MKTSPITIALVAVVSSLVTVGTIELLRSSPPGAQPALAIEPAPGARAGPAPREVEPLAPATPALDQPTVSEERLAELERRIAALELDATSRRAPVTTAAGELPAENDLRDLVLDWVAEERQARRRAEELEGEEERHKELEFEARFSARMVAEEHGLADWQEDGLANVILEIEMQRNEIDEGIDPLTDDPGEVEARYEEFDAWAEQRLVEELGPELYDRIFGED